MYKVIRLLTEEEKNQALKIREDVFVNEQNVPIELEIDELDSIDSTVHVGLYYKDIMIATGRILDVGTSTIHLGRIAVLKKYRGTGLGKKLVLGMEEIAKELAEGDVTSFLSAQLYAEKFYQSLGYIRENNNIYLDAGIEHVDMFKKL